MAEYCLDCGEPVEPDDRFCYYCGESLPGTELDDNQDVDGETGRCCGDCGAPADEDDQFCYFCGEPLPSRDSEAVPERRRADRHCPDCGTAVDPEDRFCLYCGERL